MLTSSTGSFFIVLMHHQSPAYPRMQQNTPKQGGRLQRTTVPVPGVTSRLRLCETGGVDLGPAFCTRAEPQSLHAGTPVQLSIFPT